LPECLNVVGIEAYRIAESVRRQHAAPGEVVHRARRNAEQGGDFGGGEHHLLGRV
jgi:hypothetical protein